MVKKGSITIFLTLLLSLMLSLICAGIESVRMAAARTQILCGMDIGLYSLFGQFDKTALKDYDLFLIDGSCGGGNLKMQKIYENMESYVIPVLEQNSQRLSVEQGAFTGFQLITDEDGEVFYQQIVQYMKDTLGSQGAQLLIEKVSSQQKQTEEARTLGIELQNTAKLQDYDSVMESAAQSSKELEEKKKAEALAQGKDPGTELAVIKPKKKVINPITIIRQIMKMGLLELVVPSGSISQKKVSGSSLLSGRAIQRGMGTIRTFEADHSYGAQLLFQAYLAEKLGCYSKPSGQGLDYQLEYILCGKKADRDNLKSTAEQLLLIREGINMAALLADPVKNAAVTSLAVGIASTFLVPPAAGVIEAALLLCWSFAESILDVRELFAGGRVPMVKTPESWQLSLENLPYLLQNLDTLRKNDASGLSYEEYLQILLLAKGRTEKVKRSMDMVELAIREKTGNQTFKLDSGIVAAEAAIDVKANNRKTFTVTRQYCYD